MTTKIKQAYALALELNLFGKRLRAVQLDVCIQIIAAVGYKNIAAATLFEQLVAYHATQKVVVAKVAKEQEVIEPVIRGISESRDTLFDVLPAGTYIVAAAQNNTPVHLPMLANVERLAKDINAEILFMPLKYTTNLDALSRKKPHYTEEAKRYLVEENTWLGGIGRVRLAVTANILPTAKQPITTAQRLNSGEQLTLVAHTKRQLKSLPRQKNGAHKWAASTGVITLRHYTDTRAGDEGEQSHFFGFIVVHVLENGLTQFFEVQCNEEGDFHYQTTKYANGKSYQTYFVEGMVLGDLHCEKMCEDSFIRALAQVKQYKPRVLALHDILDFMSRNHHNRQSGKFLYQMGQREVVEDLQDVFIRLNALAAEVGEVFIVQSNHDLALDRWLDCPHYRPDADPLNSKVYHFLKYCLYEAMDNGLEWDGLELAANRLFEVAPMLPKLADNITFGKVDQQYLVGGVDIGTHGHMGTNGARGSAKSFLEYNTPMATGHTHSPYRDGSLITVGVTGSLEMGYNKGGTSWDRANSVLYGNGIQQLIMPYAIGELQS